MSDAPKYTIKEFIEMGGLPPSELRPIAEWQRDARKAFEEVERIAERMVLGFGGYPDAEIECGKEILAALGDRFRTPKPEDN